MNDADRLDRLLPELLVEYAPHRPPDRLIPETRRALRRVRRRPVWLARLKERPMRISSQLAVGSPTMRLAAIALAALILTTLTAGTVVVGGSLLSGPAPAAACSNGPGSFEPGPELGTPRKLSTSVALSDGRVLVVGGMTPADSPLRTAEIFEPDTEAFRPAGTLRSVDPVFAIALSDDRVLALPHRSTIPAEVWDPRTETFSPVGSPAHARGDLVMVRLANGRVLVIGGNQFPGGEPTREAEIWDPMTGEFELEATLEGIVPDTATLLSDGDVLLGGLEWQSETSMPGEPWAVRWDPASGTITPTGAPNIPRADATAVRLADGRVLIVGGIDDQGVVVEAEVYDPATDGFTSAGRLAQGRFLHASTLLPDGRVLVTGGLKAASNGPISDAEIWDPETEEFSPAGSLAEARAEHGAAVMPDCSVLVMAGIFEQTDPVGVERWVPGPGTEAGA